MTGTAKYTIVLPVRNGGEYLKLCVKSILDQAFREFNLVILENCSTDGTSEWIKTLTDPRIQIIAAEKSLSIEENWQRITKIKKNEFITLIGHDDLLHPDYLSEMDVLIQKYPEASLYQTHFNLINSKGAVIRPAKKMREKESAVEFLGAVLQNRFDLFGTGFMLRSKDYDMVGGIPPYPNLLFGDFQLWMEVTKKGYKVTSPKTCFSYRVHQSTTKTSSDAKMHAAFNEFISYLQSLKKESNDFKSAIENYFPAFLDAYVKGLAHRLLRTPIAKREGLTVEKFLQQSKAHADRLIPHNVFDPLGQRSVRLAKIIDSNPVFRNLFILFRKVYPKPILK